MSESEYLVLDECYFINSYKSILRDSALPEAEVKRALKMLLEKKYLNQMYFDNEGHDFQVMDIPDLKTLSRYHYLASKAGLLAHNR